MNSTRYYVLAAISGIAWGGIAYVLGGRWMGSVIWGGIAASPAIGVIVAAAYRPAYKLSAPARGLASLATLYLAAALFGLAVGIYDVAREIPDRVLGEVIWQGVLATLWGLTFTGYVLILWPLAYANHALLGRLAGSESRRA